MPFRPSAALMAALLLLVACGEAPPPAEEAPVDSGAAAAPPPYSFDCPLIDGTTPQDGIRAAVERNEQALLDALRAKDRDALNPLLADELVYVRENGQISTKQQWLDGLDEGYSQAVAEPEGAMRQYCSTVLTEASGHLSGNGEGERPEQTLSHVWAKRGQQWVLVHRQESPAGPAVRPAAPAPDERLVDLGAAPKPDLKSTIEHNEVAWRGAWLARDADAIQALQADSIVDVGGPKPAGLSGADFSGRTLRQFGYTVLVVEDARYGSAGPPERDLRARETHAWVRMGSGWRMALRHATPIR